MMTSQKFRDALWILFVVTLLTVAVLAKADPAVFALKTPGSFEYIRNGERHLARGNYKEAVHEFERAYRSSPQSDLIVANVIWIYTDYARVLAASGRFSPAIYYLAKAYTLKPGAFTAQNLAIAYARKGLEEVRREGLADAVALFSKAREVAAGFGRAAEGLAVFLYNHAVPASNERDDRIAVFLLHESLLVGESARALELLGDIIYRQGDLDQVSFYWKRAQSLDPRNRNLSDKVERLAKEIALDPSMEKADLRHFDVRYDGKLAIDTALVAEALEKAYVTVGKRLRFYPKGRTAVYLYAEDDFREIFKRPRAVRAFYDGAIRMPLPTGPLAGEEMARYIAHEYTHATLSAMAKAPVPVWLAEGVAVSLEADRDGMALRDALARVGDLSDVTADSIDAAFENADKDLSGLDLYYVLAGTMVQYVTDTFGDEALRGILKRVMGGQHFINAMDDQLLLSEAEFERRWREYVYNMAKTDTNERSR